MTQLEEKIHFIQEHRDEIKPLLDKEEASFLDSLGGKFDPLDHVDLTAKRAIVGNLLQRFETKLFFAGKDNHDAGAMSVLFTAEDTGAYTAIRALITAAEKDPRCKGIGVLVAGVATKAFIKEFGDRFDQINNEPGVLLDILNLANEKPFEVIVASVSSMNGPESVTLFGGKSNLGTKKIFFVFEGWGGPGSAFNANRERMDGIDGMFCNDIVAAKIIKHWLPEFPNERILITGTPVLDSLRIENSQEYISTARRKLGLGPDTVSMLYCGDISFSYKAAGREADERINERTFETTLKAMISLAGSRPQKKYAILLRPHPADPNKEELYSLARDSEKPANLTVVPAVNPEVSIQEARLAADAVASIISTENFIAPIVGRNAIFLGYETREFKRSILVQTYGQEIANLIGKADPKIKVAVSSDDLCNFMDTCVRAPEDLSDLPIMSRGSAVSQMMNVIFK